MSCHSLDSPPGSCSTAHSCCCRLPCSLDPDQPNRKKYPRISLRNVRASWLLGTLLVCKISSSARICCPSLDSPPVSVALKLPMSVPLNALQWLSGFICSCMIDMNLKVVEQTRHSSMVLHFNTNRSRLPPSLEPHQPHQTSHRMNTIIHSASSFHWQLLCVCGMTSLVSMSFHVGDNQSSSCDSESCKCPT